MEGISNIGNLMNLSKETPPLDTAVRAVEVDRIDVAVLKLDKS